MKRIVLCVLLLCLQVFAANAADTYPKNKNIDARHYIFRLSLSDKNDMISGKTSVDITFRKSGITEFSLDLVGTSKAKPTGMKVESVKCREEKLHFTHKKDRLKIKLKKPSKAGETLHFSIVYSGIAEEGLIISKNKFSDRTFFGDNWPDRCRHWLPVIDHPYDKATCEFLIKAPEKYQVIGSGLKVEETNLQNGLRLTHWKENVPIPTYCMVIGVAEFAVLHYLSSNGIPLQTWVFPKDRDNGFYDFALAENILEFFAGKIGPYPYEKLASVQSNTLYGGMENSGNIFYYEKSVTGERTHEGLIVHEMAHQWFGDSVTEADWNHVWLSEGLATYFDHIYNEFKYGRDFLVRELESGRQEIIEHIKKNPKSVIIDTSITNPENVLNTNTYQKASWALHMLRGIVGEENFWKGIRNYYKKYRDKTVMTSDFIKVMEKTSSAELDSFFDSWFYSPGIPKIKGNWSYDKASQTLIIKLKQVQKSGTLYKMPVEIGIYSNKDNGPLIKTVSMDKLENRFRINLLKEPHRVALDPNTWLLMQSEFGKIQK